jgi:hypothetical protein
MVGSRRKAEWARAGTIAAAVYNVHKRKGGKTIKPSDFYKPLGESNVSWKQAVEQFKKRKPKQ